MRLHLRYGREGLDVDVPDRNLAAVLRLKRLPKLDDPVAATREALANPIATPPLKDIARGRRDAVVVVSDITRPVPNRVILPPVIEALGEAGIGSRQVTILVGTGLHRPNTDDELREMLGADIVDSGCRIVNHVARDMDAQAHLGETARGTPVCIDRTYLEADLKILTGLIEPHLMAGYSGGRKAICPSIAGQDTIVTWHGPRFLEPDEARAGNLVNNPVHEEALAVARIAGGADFIVNVTMDDQRDVTGVFAGDMIEAHLAGVRHLDPAVTATLPEPVDIVVTTNAGYPLDLTHYQGIKGMIAAVPIVKQGGTIIIAHECAEGLGGEEFAQLILEVEDIEAYIKKTYEPGFFVIDQWQLHEMGKVLRRAEVYNCSEGVPKAQQERLFVTPIDSVEQGIEMALDKHGPDAGIAVIPDGPYVLAALA
jgi:nickel-dependent lactate racemase